MKASNLAHGGKSEIGRRSAGDFRAFPGLGSGIKCEQHQASGMRIGPPLNTSLNSVTRGKEISSQDVLQSAAGA